MPSSDPMLERIEAFNQARRGVVVQGGARLLAQGSLSPAGARLHNARPAENHPEYLLAMRPGRLILDLIDVDKVSFIAPEIASAALNAIRSHDACRRPPNRSTNP